MTWNDAKDRCTCPEDFVDELVEDFGTDEERCKTKSIIHLFNLLIFSRVPRYITLE